MMDKTIKYCCDFLYCKHSYESFKYANDCMKSKTTDNIEYTFNPNDKICPHYEFYKEETK